MLSNTNSLHFIALEKNHAKKSYFALTIAAVFLAAGSILSWQFSVENVKNPHIKTFPNGTEYCDVPLVKDNMCPHHDKKSDFLAVTYLIGIVFSFLIGLAALIVYKYQRAKANLSCLLPCIDPCVFGSSYEALDRTERSRCSASMRAMISSAGSRLRSWLYKENTSSDVIAFDGSDPEVRKNFLN